MLKFMFQDQKWMFLLKLQIKSQCFFLGLNERIIPDKGFQATQDFYFSIDLLHYKQLKRMLFRIL